MDLDTLKALAKIKWAGHNPFTGETILALIARVEQAEAALARVQNAAKVLVAGADRRVMDATAHEPAARVAITTLDSERDMNAILTAEVQRLEAALAALKAERTPCPGHVCPSCCHETMHCVHCEPTARTCEWIQDVDDYFWSTDCGVTWMFDSDGPTENRMKFCHHCGGRLVVRTTPPEPSDE